VKAWVRTKIIGSGAEEDPRRPDLKGLRLNYSMIELGDGTCLCRISGREQDIQMLLSYTDVTELTDEEAESLIKSVNPKADLTCVDVRDEELDEIATNLGLNPIEIRKRSGARLHDQEWGLIKEIASRKGVDVSSYEADFKKGKVRAIKRIRRELKYP